MYFGDDDDDLQDVTCGGGFVCQEDTFTFEQIKKPCIATSNSSCISCESVRMAQGVAFNKDPKKHLFNVRASTEDEKNAFWIMLNDHCGITRPEKEEIDGKISVVIPDTHQTSAAYHAVRQRYSNSELPKSVDAFTFALLNISRMHAELQEIADDVEHDKDSRVRAAKNLVSEEIQRLNLRCSLVHHPFEMPFLSASLLIAWHHASDKQHGNLTTFLDREPAACADGTFELMFTILTTPDTTHADIDTNVDTKGDALMTMARKAAGGAFKSNGGMNMSAIQELLRTTFNVNVAMNSTRADLEQALRKCLKPATS